ncbi:MAG: hypothetical protein ABRQ38_01460 [Candidatus Eremiobacterota bacterium]
MPLIYLPFSVGHGITITTDPVSGVGVTVGVAGTDVIRGVAVEVGIFIAAVPSSPQPDIQMNSKTIIPVMIEELNALRASCLKLRVEG